MECRVCVRERERESVREGEESGETRGEAQPRHDGGVGVGGAHG